MQILKLVVHIYYHFISYFNYFNLGDKDFIPALQKTRLLAKRVAICSFKNSCNNDLSNNVMHIRDFDMIWLEDYIETIFIPKLDK